MLLLFISVPFLRQLFHFENPGIQHFYPAIGAGFFMLFVLEMVKFVKIRLLQRSIRQ
jgi:hypothetical protein